MSIKTNLTHLQQRIEQAASRAGRNSHEIQLMPVTKTVEPTLIREALLAGYSIIGENKVQEIQQKQSALADVAHQIHLIGHLQTNKVKDIIGKVSCIQSLDSIKLAEKIQQRLEFIDNTINVLIQVNTSGEKSKTGIIPSEVLKLIQTVIDMPRLKIQGFMTIGTNTDQDIVIRQCFRQLVHIQQQAREKFSHRANFDTLSMGMSNDMEIAIEEGSTLIRVGGAIFGKRNTPKNNQ